jgi:hypothetical protein
MFPPCIPFLQLHQMFVDHRWLSQFVQKSRAEGFQIVDMDLFQ